MQGTVYTILFFCLEATPTCGAVSCRSDWECFRCLSMSASPASLLFMPTEGEFSGSGGRGLELAALI